MELCLPKEIDDEHKWKAVPLRAVLYSVVRSLFGLHSSILFHYQASHTISKSDLSRPALLFTLFVSSMHSEVRGRGAKRDPQLCWRMARLTFLMGNEVENNTVVFWKDAMM